MIGALVSIPLPESKKIWQGEYQAKDPLHDYLRTDHKLELPIFAWPSYPNRLARVSAQAYVKPEWFADLAQVLNSKFG